MDSWLGSSGETSLGMSAEEDMMIAALAAGFKRSAGRTPNARAAASEAGRFAASEEMIFLRNL